MRNLSKIYCAYRRNNGFIIGMLIGLCVSLLFYRITNFQEDFNNIESSWYKFSLTTNDQPSTVDEYAPKININLKPNQLEKNLKAFIRPRYYYTELGIREKLFVGVLTSSEYLHSRGVAFNKTIGRMIEKIRYFISVNEGSKKPNVSLSGIVGFTDTRSILKPFHVIKYITDNYLEDYDYYFIVKDTSYINARNLLDFVDSTSANKDIYVGSSIESDYCSLEGGILISNSILQKLKKNLDWCVNNIYSESDDINLGRCITHTTKMSCQNQVEGKNFHSEKLPLDFDFYENFSNFLREHENVNKAISIFPIPNYKIVYYLNAYFAAINLRNTDKAIEGIRKEILSTIHLEPAHYRKYDDSGDKNIFYSIYGNKNENIHKNNLTSWPIGNGPGNKAPGRFDLLRWNYFNETHILLPTDFENTKELIGSQRFDVHRIIEITKRKLIKEYEHELKFDRLINGYIKFDASRGMDYILDLSLINTKIGKKITKRFEVSKPLGKVKLLPVPYVTENTRVNMILIVTSWKTDQVMEFIENYTNICLEKNDKTTLMLVFLYNANSPSKGDDDIYKKVKLRVLSLTEKYKKEQSKIAWLSVQLPPSLTSIEESDPILRIAIADLIVKKFSSESLILFVQTHMELKTEYLNRVRMNTISQWQIFSPIPFSTFHPDIISLDNPKSTKVDLTHHHGRYDNLNYESISFYLKDYRAVRKQSAKEIPIINTDKDLPDIIKISKNNFVESIFELFVIYSDLHVFRAVEPALKIYYNKQNCSGMLSETAKSSCYSQMNLQLGHRGQLAKLIQEYSRIR
ncbi:chondroitin sulfate synthase 2 [Chelonus insularis]|uniref:chondroitin sulfate synthase 2 n=1 Tax=Chelonus insularis TaxID=460826 RepID=UPI00158DCD5C|nr:chondroitin sulfate synthase 2 [Chelonus insularis]